jgi:outer membrane immunogenic protein
VYTTVGDEKLDSFRDERWWLIEVDELAIRTDVLIAARHQARILHTPDFKIASMRMKTVLLASSVLLALSAHALAADPQIGASATPSFDWTGFYAGGQIGGGWVNKKTNDDPNSVGIGLGGVIGGAYAGYNWQIPGSSVVLGIDTDVVLSGVDGSGGNPVGNTASGKWDWYGATRGRLGYAFDRFLPYVAGGVAYGHVKASYGFPDGTIYSGGKTDTGWTIGGGFEYALTDTLIARAEYRYTDFGKTHVTLSNGGFSNVSEVDLPVHDIRIGLAYKF